MVELLTAPDVRKSCTQSRRVLLMFSDHKAKILPVLSYFALRTESSGEVI